MDSSKLSTRELHLIRSKMWNTSMENHGHYIDPETMRFAEKFVEKRNCPACDQSNDTVIFQKSGGDYACCNDCGMVYLNPVFKQEYLKEYYGRNHAVQSEIVEMDNQFYQKIYAKGLALLENAGAKKGNILDVGCSSGVFLDLAKKSDWKTFGVELNRQELAYATKKGHIVQGETIDKANFEVKMDTICLWDVFEHIPDGVTFLQQASAQLASGGCIFIQSPQSSSLAARILQQKCNMFDGLEHVNLYNHETLSRVVRTAGFELAAFQTIIPELGVTSNYLNYQDPYLGRSDNNNTFLNLISDETILEKGLGYKFQAVLKKK